MLIEFKVANYRSFREEQTLSFVASNTDKGVLPENIIDLSLPGMSGLSYLKSIALFGPNASGKSNLLNALRNFSKYVALSAPDMGPNDETDAEPFKLDRSYLEKPSFFEIAFVAEGVRYLFGLSVTPHKIHEEYLIAYPKGLPQQWYHRKWDSATCQYIWKFNPSFKKGRASLEKLVRPNATFISTGALFEHEQLKTIYHWFMSNCELEHVNSFLSTGMTLSLLGDSSIKAEELLSFMKKADLGITNIQINKNENNNIALSKEFNVKNTDGLDEYKIPSISFVHSTGKSSVELDLHDESTGTLSYFNLLGPCLYALKQPRVLLVDELDTSLHPKLTEALITFFHKHSKTSQILFTTHNPFLLDNKVLRRDQVWFTEKDKSGASKLFPLTDFSPRKDEARVKAYMSGRYGAVPFLEEVLQ